MMSERVQANDLRSPDLHFPAFRNHKDLEEHLEQDRKTRRAVMVGEKILSVLLGVAAGGLILKLIGGVA